MNRPFVMLVTDYFDWSVDGFKDGVPIRELTSVDLRSFLNELFKVPFFSSFHVILFKRLC